MIFVNALSRDLLAFAAQNGTFDDPEVSYICRNFDEWLATLDAARALCSSGLISSSMRIIANPAITKLPGDIPPLVFSITQEGLDALSRERDAKS